MHKCIKFVYIQYKGKFAKKSRLNSEYSLRILDDFEETTVIFTYGVDLWSFTRAVLIKT